MNANLPRDDKNTATIAIVPHFLLSSSSVYYNYTTRLPALSRLLCPCGRCRLLAQPQPDMIDYCHTMSKEDDKAIKETSVNVNEETLLAKYIMQLEILAQFRGLQHIVCEEEEKMGIFLDLEKDIRFQQGKEKGREEGFQQGLKKGLIEGMELAVKIKFGNDGLFVMEKIETISDMDTLERIKGYILEASSVIELMRLINGGNK